MKKRWSTGDEKNQEKTPVLNLLIDSEDNFVISDKFDKNKNSESRSRSRAVNIYKK
jgi:hypothetical protein